MPCPPTHQFYFSSCIKRVNINIAYIPNKTLNMVISESRNSHLEPNVDLPTQIVKNEQNSSSRTVSYPSTSMANLVSMLLEHWILFLNPLCRAPFSVPPSFQTVLPLTRFSPKTQQPVLGVRIALQLRRRFLTQEILLLSGSNRTPFNSANLDTPTESALSVANYNDAKPCPSAVFVEIEHH